MVSSMSNNFYFNDAVTRLYTAGSTAKLVSTVVDSYIKKHPGDKVATDEIIEKIFTNDSDEDENEERSINDVLRDYTNNISQYLKKIQDQTSGNTLKRTDYQSVGMEGYFDVQETIQLSKALTAYSANKSSDSNTPTNTFIIGV